MLEKITFSSDALPPHLTDRARFELWHDIHNAEIASFDYGMAETQPFAARIEALSLGRIALGEMAGTINRAERSKSNISEDSGQGYCLLVNTGANRMGGVQRGREFVIGAGAAVLISNSEAIKMEGGERTNWMSVLLPEGTLNTAFKGVDDQLALEIGADSAALGMLRRYCAFIDDSAGLMSPALIAHAADTIIDLVGLASSARRQDIERSAMSGVRAARLAAVIQNIRLYFSDPAISAQTVARALGLSTRYVHDLLQETGTGFSERVLEMRLQKTRVMLSDRRNDAMLVSEIALSCGFNDVSHFNRSFRRRFGCTPRSVR